MFDSRPPRVGAALGTSIAFHVLVVTIIATVGFAHHTVSQQITRPTYNIVWTVQPGTGGGGGGGGTSNPLPPQQQELPKPVKPPKMTPAPQPVNTPPLPVLDIPAASLSSVVESLPGVPDGDSTGSQGSGTGGGAGTGSGTGRGSGHGSGLGDGFGGGTGGGYYRPGNGVTLPRVLREVRPRYTLDAMRAKIQGTVEVDIIVLPDGTVGDMRIAKSLDRVFGLNEQALEAVKQWRFAPGTKDGRPVAVFVTIELSFSLR